MSARGKGARPPQKQRGAAPAKNVTAQALDRATQLHRAGDLAAAASAYDEILRGAPNRADVLHLRGLVALQSRDASARPYLERAVALSPSSVPYRINLANALRIEGELAAAITLLEAVLEDASDDAMVHAALSRSLATHGELERAARHARRASEIDPTSFAHLAVLGSLLRRGACHAEARDVLQRAVSVAETRPAAVDLATTWNDLGLVQEALGELAAASASYERATAIDPSFAEAFNNIGRLAHGAEKFETAIGFFEKALALGGDPASIESNLGNALRACGSLEAAERHYRLSIAARPDFASAHSNLGNVLRERGDLDAAAACYLRAIELDPQFALAHSNLGSLRRQQGEYTEAIRWFARARELNPRLQTAYVALSWLLPAVGRADELPVLFFEWNVHLPEDPIGRHMRAAADETAPPPPRASSEYVTTLFDDFANTFDATLAKLEYCGPAVVTAALVEVLPSSKVPVILDAGCGTGLCGPLLRPLADRLEGVDLSEGMLRIARERGVYDRLERADLVEFLNGAANTYDGIVLADVVNYFGDLRELFESTARAARGAGIVVFTTEKGTDGSTFRLLPSGRYCHVETYLREVLTTAGFSVESIRSEVARSELGRPVEAFVVVARVATPQ